jgi:hypothetical protein
MNFLLSTLQNHSAAPEIAMEQAKTIDFKQQIFNKLI